MHRCRTLLFATVAAGASALLPTPGSAAILALDFDELDVAGGTVVTAAGFQSFTIDSANAVVTTPVIRTYGPLTVTLAPSNATIGFDDRVRLTPTNNGAFTQADLLTDFVFSRSTGTQTDGLDLTISGLSPVTPYQFTIWSFDSGSAGPAGGGRVSDWFANGVEVVSNYTFNGTVLPTDNSQYQFTFTSTTDASGAMLIGGRRDTASVDASSLPSIGVFLNAVQVDVVPEPGSAALLGIAAVSWGISFRRRQGRTR